VGFDRRSLDGLGVLGAVVEAGSFVRAGEALGLTQSAVSRAVARLEDRVGVRLFRRTARSISLTDEGRRFYESVAPHLAAIVDATTEAGGSSSRVRGRLRVNVDAGIGQFVLTPRLQPFLAQHPDLAVEIAARDRMGDLVRDGFDVSGCKCILDAGCGNGRYSKFLLSEAGGDAVITGFDYSQQMLQRARKRLQSGSTAAGRSTPPAPKDALPVITFNDRATVHINGEDIRAIHMPHGHTDGDAVIWFTQSNVVHMGDDFFNGTFPFVDIDNGGSVRGLSMNLEAIIAQIRDDTKVIPGHGPLGDKATLRTFAEMIRTSSAAVDAAMRSGKTLDQIKQQKVLDPWSKWASSFITVDRWADTLYRDLGGTLPPAPATSTQHH